MTRIGSFLVLTLLAAACHKTAASDSPTNVPVGSAVGNEASEPPTPSEPVPAKPVSSCGLRATLREIGSKDPSVHRFAIDLKNEGQRPVKLTKPGDGSTEGWRTPTLTFTATANGKAAAKQDLGRCGNMNSLKLDEVFTLNPGETKTLDEWVDPMPFEAGTYDLKVRYTNSPSAGTRGLTSSPNDDVKQAFASTDACEVTSNAIKVTYVNVKTL